MYLKHLEYLAPGHMYICNIKRYFEPIKESFPKQDLTQVLCDVLDPEFYIC